ncbi:MAG: DUF2797 domain-containing protein [Proteobacteria bacterium]|nr:DUF2797 domain-containing protein [Pseudomonadota bacterium]
MVVEATLPVSYSLPLNNLLFPLNDLLGKTLKLKFMQQIHCVACKKPIKKSYQDGYCFPCTQTLAQSDICIIKPERCHFHLGTCREPDWGQHHCMAPHIVYLANASGIKVGITRKTNIPTRWIDQGAISAMPLYEVPNRRVSGLVEIALAQHVPDKTNWRKMLSGQTEEIDLISLSKNLLKEVASKFDEIYEKFGAQALKLIEKPVMVKLEYPVLEYPQKITSLSFDKKETIEGTLLGIKGQYLIFDIGVLNIRKHSGYVVAVHA